jgi:hypothetical protein
MPPKVAKQSLAAKKKLDNTAVTLSPGAQEAMAGVTTIMNAKLESLTYAVNARSGDAKQRMRPCNRSTACS